MDERNTRLTIYYRDRSSYRTGDKRIVLAGQITEAEVAKIAMKLGEGGRIICEQVGLPTPSDEFVGRDFPGELDHVFSIVREFEDGLPLAHELWVTDAPTDPRSVHELVAAILRVVSWDVATEWERLTGGASPRVPLPTSIEDIQLVVIPD